MSKNIITLFNQNKAYIVAVLTGISAGASALGYHIPEYVYAVLAAFGITVVHNSIAAVNAKIAAPKD